MYTTHMIVKVHQHFDNHIGWVCAVVVGPSRRYPLESDIRSDLFHRHSYSFHVLVLDHAVSAVAAVGASFLQLLIPLSAPSRVSVTVLVSVVYGTGTTLGRDASSLYGIFHSQFLNESY